MFTRTLPALAIVLFLVLAGCGSQAQPTQTTPPATPVRIAAVTQEARALPIRTTGRLAPKAQMQLSFKTGGLINRIYADEGDAVRAGQLLARLDLAEIDARVQQAQSNVTKAQRDAERMQALFRDSVATLEQAQNTETALEVAQSDLRIARFNRQHSEIRAPADGRVLRRQAEVSELVTPGEPIFVFGAAQGWVVRAGLADRDVVQVQQGDEATIHFDAFPDRSFTGFVSELAEAADPASGTFEVEVAVADPDGLLKTGFIARVNLYPSGTGPLYVIPIEALVEGDGREGVVYTVADSSDVARRVPVRIAEIFDDEVAVTSGLETVESVITDGAPYLTDGARVQIVRGE